MDFDFLFALEWTFSCVANRSSAAKLAHGGSDRKRKGFVPSRAALNHRARAVFDLFGAAARFIIPIILHGHYSLMDLIKFLSS